MSTALSKHHHKAQHGGDSNSFEGDSLLRLLAVNVESAAEIAVMPNRTRDRGVKGKLEIVDRRTTPNSDADPSTGAPVGTRFSRNEAINMLYRAFQGRFSRELVSDVLANKRSSVADALESLKALCQNTGPSTSSSQSARQNQTHNGKARLYHCCT